ncbi:hypothetical protein ACLB2K_034113 [Fragaria x ananassa]
MADEGKTASKARKWWKNLDFANKLPFARNKIVEAYFWALASLFEPEYHFARILLCKCVALTTVLDDVYDVYGTYEELERFTEAIERWDISAVDQLQLPECMEVCYKGLLDSYSGYEEKLADEGNLYRIEYAKEAIVKATALIGRLLNDIAGHKFEQTNEQCATSVECYMNQYGVGEEEAKIELTKQKEAAWKDLNQEWLDLHSSNSIPNPLLQIILNLACSSEVLYNNMEGFTNSETGHKGFIYSLLVEPVPV